MLFNTIKDLLKIVRHYFSLSFRTMHRAAIRALELSENDESKFVNYYSQVNHRGKTYHPLPWYSVALLNCNEDGSVVNLNESKLFSRKGKNIQAWLLMKLKIFYIEVITIILCNISCSHISCIFYRI